MSRVLVGLTGASKTTLTDVLADCKTGVGHVRLLCVGVLWG